MKNKKTKKKRVSFETSWGRVSFNSSKKNPAVENDKNLIEKQTLKILKTSKVVWFLNMMLCLVGIIYGLFKINILLGFCSTFFISLTVVCIIEFWIDEIYKKMKRGSLKI